MHSCTLALQISSSERDVKGLVSIYDSSKKVIFVCHSIFPSNITKFSGEWKKQKQS